VDYEKKVIFFLGVFVGDEGIGGGLVLWGNEKHIKRLEWEF